MCLDDKAVAGRHKLYLYLLSYLMGLLLSKGTGGYRGSNVTVVDLGAGDGDGADFGFSHDGGTVGKRAAALYRSFVFGLIQVAYANVAACCYQ
jgi:hypothetical protein